jgi:hypothetical protein
VSKHTHSDGQESSDNKKSGKDKILSEAKARFKLAEEAESDIRRETLDDLEFVSGNHWPEAVKRAREADGRPCLTINKLPQKVKQITNDQRQNKPSIKVHPVDDQGDPKTAKIIQGLIRNIEYVSNADVAYNTAFDSAVKGGFGYFRIITGYVDPKSFDQEILIKRIRNPLSVLFDPYSQELDGADANYAFITEDLPKDEYKALYPDSKGASPESWELLETEAQGWMREDSVRVCEYFYKEHELADICLLSTGDVVLKSDLEQILQIKAMQGSPASVVSERKTRIPKIKWCKLNGLEILEETDWPGKYIPIIPVYGDELDVNGKKILAGLVRHAKDSARMYNYWKSAETEAIALAPRAPFIAAEGQLEGYEHEWAEANRRNFSVLTYKPKSVDGTVLPPPQRNSFEPAIGAITQAGLGASEDEKATTGLYDSSMGRQSNETSGVAIQRRASQAQTANFHFNDNMNISLRHAGRICIDLIPHIYDTARASRIIGEEGDERIVQLNAPTKDQGEDMLYDLQTGRYDCTVDVGPSYATKRQEAAASMMEVSRAVPQLMGVAGDLMIKAMDWPGASEISERLKKTLPPGLADDEKGDKKPIPPEVQAQMQQMGQMVEQLTSKVNEQADLIQQKRVELESRERIEMAKLELQATIKLAELQSKEASLLLQNQVRELDARQKMLGSLQPIPDVTEDEQVSPMPPAGAEMDAGMSGMDPNGGAAPVPMEGIDQ